MRISIFIPALLIACFLSTSAFAHRVNVFAWLDGTTVHTESYFSSGKKAQGSTVTATDKKTGDVIATGKTDNNGTWSFTLTDALIQSKSPIVISLDAGQGHAGSWTIEAEDFSSVPHTAQTPKIDKATPVAPASSPSSSITLTKAELDIIVRNAVKEETAPLAAQLSKLHAEIMQPETSAKDIFGGIGYILGLLGLAAFMQYRRKP